VPGDDDQPTTPVEGDPPDDTPERTITTLDEALAALSETRAEARERRQRLAELGPLTKLEPTQVEIMREIAESVVNGDSETTFNILVEQARAMAGASWRDIISSTFDDEPTDKDSDMADSDSGSDMVSMTRDELQQIIRDAAQEIVDSRFSERDQRTAQERMVDEALDVAKDLGYKRDAENPVTRALLWAALSREGDADMPITERVKAAHENFQSELAGFSTGTQRDAGDGTGRDARSTGMPPPPPSSGSGAQMPNPDGDKLSPREKAMRRLEAQGLELA